MTPAVVSVTDGPSSTFGWSGGQEPDSPAGQNGLLGPRTEESMPLQDGYGVVIGSVTRHFIDQPNAEGQWPHYHIYVRTPDGEYECVVNL